MNGPEKTTSKNDKTREQRKKHAEDGEMKGNKYYTRRESINAKQYFGRSIFYFMYLCRPTK